MKRYLKLLSLFGLLILLAAPLFNSKEARADVNTLDAQSWEQVENGKFLSRYIGQCGDGGYHYSSFKPKFNTHSKWLYTNHGKINLKVRTDGTETNTDKPYRYWFWVKANNLASNKLHWSTEYFIGTLRDVPKPYNAYYYSDCARVDRLIANANPNSFFKSIGSSIDGHGLCLYVVDIKNWYDKLSKKQPYSGFLYLQTIAAIYNGSQHWKGPFSTLKEWEEAAKAKGFDSDGIAEYPAHYNQRINLNRSIKFKYKVHKIATTPKHPILGDYSSAGLLHETQVWKETTPSTLIKLSNIRGHLKKDG